MATTPPSSPAFPYPFVVPGAILAAYSTWGKSSPSNK